MKFDYGHLLSLTNKEFADAVQRTIEAQSGYGEVMSYYVNVDHHGLTEDEVKENPEENSPFVVVDILAGRNGNPFAHWTYWFDTFTKKFDHRVVNYEMVERYKSIVEGKKLPSLQAYTF